MRTDSNVNISSVYLKIVHCTKVLIWSAVDEVISNGSSLKLGVLSQMVSQSESKPRKNDELNSPTNLISEGELN